jgi:type VI secretion system secreted protein Hcp
MAAVDYFLKIDGIEGESQDDKHAAEIDVLSWSWGEARSDSAPGGAGGGAGKVQMQDLHFTARVSKASPKLLLACAGGTHVKNARLTCRTAGKAQQEFLKLTFTDVLVSSFQTGGSATSDVVPLDQVSLAYARIEVEYREQKANGTLGAAVKAGWDLKKNQKL